MAFGRKGLFLVFYDLCANYPQHCQLPLMWWCLYRFHLRDSLKKRIFLDAAVLNVGKTKMYFVLG